METERNILFEHCYTKDWARAREEYRYLMDSIPAYFFIRCVLPGLILAMGIGFALAGWWKAAVFFAVVFLLLLYRLFVFPKRRLKKRFWDTTRMFGAESWEESMTFGEKIEISSGGKVAASLEWSCCRKVEEDSEWLRLFCQGNMTFLLKKENFIKGTAEEFRAWLKQEQPHVIWHRKK